MGNVFKIAGKLVGQAGQVVLIIGLMTAMAWAAEPVKINSLLTYPDAYKMKVVRVEGTVSGHRMHHFIGNQTKLEKCIQNFSVEDSSGAIDASYATICDKGTVMLQDGDHVTIEGHFLGNLDVRLVSKH